MNQSYKSNNIVKLMRKALSSIDVAVTRHSSRAVLRVEGADTEKFMQNFLTHDITHLKSTNALHAAMLSPQGRILFDVFVYRDAHSPSAVLVEHLASRTNQLQTHLKRYKLRSKVEFTDVSQQLSVVSVLGEKIREIQDIITPSSSSSSSSSSTSDALFVAKDNRSPNMGIRILSSNPEQQIEKLLQSNSIAFTRTDERVYDLYRTCQGVPTDPNELVLNESLPSESTLDHLDAISYSKGCYLGQELTARTHFRGITRKMLLPVVPHVPSSNADEPLEFGNGSLFANWRDDVLGHSFGLALPPAATKLQLCGEEEAQEEQNDEASTPAAAAAPARRRRRRRAADGKMISDNGGAGFALLRLEQLTTKPLESTIFKVANDDSDNSAISNDCATHIKCLKPHWWEAQMQKQTED